MAKPTVTAVPASPDAALAIVRDYLEKPRFGSIALKAADCEATPLCADWITGRFFPEDRPGSITPPLC